MLKKRRLEIAIILSLLIHFLSVGVVSLRDRKKEEKHNYVDIQLLEAIQKRPSRFG